MCGFRLVDAQRYLIGDGDAVAFEGDNFFRVIGEHTNIFEPEVNQDLRADAALVLDHALARRLAIELAASMKMNLRKRAGALGGIDGEATASVMEVEEHTAIFFRNSFERAGNQFAAITGSGTEDIAGKAMRMHAD